MSSAALRWIFGPFAVDPANACLWRGTEAVALSPKAFDVLYYLVQHPNRVVTKDELLDAVWPETAVTDAVVRVAIGILRKVLDDTAPPRFIATVPRRGYRFLAPVTVADASASNATTPAPQASPSPAPPPLLVGREALLQRLGEAWARARQGQRQVVWVTGEAGMGKTTVVEAFRTAATTDLAVWLAAGQCVEHYGTGEAYLPVLEALGQLCRGLGGARLVGLLQQHAPTWLVQMPWLLTTAHREQLRDELQGVTRERMLREFAEVVDTLTAATPLVLILEDLHWSDYATLDLLALLARRRTPARLLVIGTYRPVEAIVHHHPLRTVVQDLQRHGHATELPLALLSVEAVAAYLVARFPRQQFPAALVPWLHQRTDGHPLFLVTLVQALVEWGVLQAHDECWTVQEGLETLAVHVPESLRQLLEQQITRLPLEAQRVLEVASVGGAEFVAAAVAAGLEADAATVEEHCETLVGQQLLRPLGVATWPDGTVTTRYAFVHALYQQMMYERLGAGRRVRLHQRLGGCLETAFGAQAGEIAAELAEHFVRGQDTQHAVHYLYQAAENALHCCANQEAIRLLTQELELLTTLPDTPERSQQELILQTTLGPALIATRGYAAPDVAQTYARARDLCRHMGDTPQLFVALRGLQTFHAVRAELPMAAELAEELLLLAQRQHDPTLLVFAHLSLGSTLFHRGAFVQARVHLEQGTPLNIPQQDHDPAFLYGHGPGVVCISWAALALWLLGYPEQALQKGHEAITWARQLAQPFSLAFALNWVAWLHQLRREPQAAQDQAEAAMALCTEQGFAQLLAFGRVLRGWALAARQQGENGIAHIHQGLAAYQATGAAVGRPQQLALLAEAHGQVRQAEAGLAVLTEALTVVGQTGERSYEAELHRLTGELLLARSAVHHTEAEACFRQALDVARHQQAKSLELRAAMSLARLWQQQGKRTEAHQLLAEVYGWFTEGFDTADLQEAKALLDTLC
jgi:DNA-binding winged helix-turn-helix (wHTH) protein/predicted ATPase